MIWNSDIYIRTDKHCTYCPDRLSSVRRMGGVCLSAQWYTIHNVPGFAHRRLDCRDSSMFTPCSRTAASAGAPIFHLDSGLPSRAKSSDK